MLIRSDIIGKKFNMLTVLEFVEPHIAPNGQKVSMCKCKCECGNTTIASATNVKRGNTKSCGCLRSTENTKVHYKHGEAFRKKNTRLYKIWKGMYSRCYCRGDKSYHYYGGRGITVCDEWKNDYKSFMDWAYENGYDENAPRWECTIDRINNDRNYEPNNCRWVNMDIQRKNKRKWGTANAYQVAE